MIVVDNRPGTGVALVLDQVRTSLPVPAELVEEPVPGIPQARNRAVAAALARGADLLAFVDDDDLPEPDWLARLLEVQAASDADIVYGGARHPPDAPIPGWLRRLEHFRPHALDPSGTAGVPRGASTCNVLLSARLLRRLAAQGEVFRTRLSSGEDLDLFQRASRMGCTSAVAAASRVVLGWEPSRYTLRGLVHRRFDRGLAHSHRSLQQGEEIARVRAQARHRLIRAARKLPRRLASREAAVTQLLRLAEHAGEVLASFGFRTRYYGRP